MEKKLYFCRMKKFLVILLLITTNILVFSQRKDSIERNFHSYNKNIINFEEKSIYRDTTLDNFSICLPQQEATIYNLGYQNPGNPIIRGIYSKNEFNHDFLFFNNYASYVTTHEEIAYFDTKKPFTIFKFTGGSKKLDNAFFLHSQNLGSSVNFALKYNGAKSDGRYMYNNARFHNLNGSFAFTKRKYEAHFNALFNRIQHNENGGLSGNFFEDSQLAENNILTNLSSANTKISHYGVELHQELKFGHYQNDTNIVKGKSDTVVGKILKSKFSILHKISFDKYYKLYTDVPSAYYSNYYFNNTATNDSIALMLLKNGLFFNINLESKKAINKFQILAGLENNLYQYYTPDTTRANKNSSFLTGILILDTEKNKFFSKIQYGVLGWQMFDFNLNATNTVVFNKKINLDAAINYSLQKPDYYYSYYHSNNFIWENDSLSRENRLEGKIRVNFNKIFLSFGADINLLGNYMTFDSMALPYQVKDANVIFDIFAEKTFNIKNVHIMLNATYQYIKDKSKIALPDYFAYANIYWQRPLFKNALRFQLGVDCYFIGDLSGFNYAYMPASNVFYVKEGKKLQYPNISAYLSIKIKRFRGFVKGGNINSLFMKRNFYLLDKVPDNPLGFYFGISWEFYD